MQFYRASLMFYGRTGDFSWRKAQYLASSDADALAALDRLVTRWHSDDPAQFHVVRECTVAALEMAVVDENGRTGEQAVEPFYRFASSEAEPNYTDRWKRLDAADREFEIHLASRKASREMVRESAL